MLRVILLSFFAMLLSGCILGPGMQMRATPVASTISENNKISPHFIKIDVDLIRYINRTYSKNLDEGYYYHIGSHDVLNIHVWGHPELSGPLGVAPSEQGVNAPPSLAPVGYLVSTDGNIYFPMLGNVHVVGKTVEQCRSILTRLLKKYVRKPDLDVRVSGFRSKKIYIMGEVMKPGLQPLTDSPMTITDAINLAGGLDKKSADPRQIFVIRGDYARPDVYWLDANSPDTLILAENFRLQGNDVVFVSAAAISRLNRAIDQVLPTIQTIWFTASLINNP